LIVTVLILRPQKCRCDHPCLLANFRFIALLLGEVVVPWLRLRLYFYIPASARIGLGDLRPRRQIATKRQTGQLRKIGLREFSFRILFSVATMRRVATGLLAGHGAIDRGEKGHVDLCHQSPS